MHNASNLTKNGKFAEIQKLYPEKILFSDDEHRLLITTGNRSQNLLPTLIMYTVNHCIQYKPEEQLFYIIKNRYGESRNLCTLIRDLVGVQLKCVSNDPSVLEFTCEEDKVIAKLKGFLCLK